MTVGKRIRMARKLRKMTQAELGEIMGMTGSAVSLWEKGGTVAMERSLHAFSDALGVRLEWLKTGEGEMERKKTDGEIAAEATDDPLIRRIITAYLDLDEKQKDGVNEFARRFIGETGEEGLYLHTGQL